MKTRTSTGFTLLELSIVLVIVGLIAGGVLVGRDLIVAAEIRGQITQIEKYQTAVNTFQVKYGYLPGDIPEPAASGFGFVPRGQFAGEGDGNEVIEGVQADMANTNSGLWKSAGETAVFWVDLSNASLIAGSFTTARSNSFPAHQITPQANAEGLTLDNFMPKAKIGNGNYVYIWSGGQGWGGMSARSNHLNYFGIVDMLSLSTSGGAIAQMGITTSAAYSIDSKTDDGFPQTGNVRAVYAANNATYINWALAPQGQGPDPGTPTIADTNTCYDNDGVGANPMHYTIAISGGNAPNCALAFQFR